MQWKSSSSRCSKQQDDPQYQPKVEPVHYLTGIFHIGREMGLLR